MKNYKRYLSVLLISFLLIGSFSACNKKENNKETENKTEKISEKSTNEGVLKIGELWGIKNVDPAKSGVLMKEKVLNVETLVDVHTDFSIVPCLAEKWEKKDDKTWVFHLRKGVKFHNGKEMDAEAVKWALDRTISKNPTCKRLLNAQEIKVLDKDTIEIATNKVNGDLIETLAYSGFGIYSKDSEISGENIVKPIGTGPFTVKQFNPENQELILDSFKDYWGEKKGNVKQIIIKSIGDANTRALSVEKGDINFTVDPPFNEFDRLSKKKGIKLQKQTTPRNYISKFNLKKNEWKDIKVRKAVSLGIDREGIVKNVLFGVGGIPKGLFSENTSWVRPDAKPWEFNVEKAKNLLKESGYKENSEGFMEKDGKVLEMKLVTFPTRPGLPLIAQALQQNMKNIGIKVNIVVNEYSVISEMTAKGDYDMEITPYATTMVPTPSYYLETVFSSENNKKTGYNNPKVDELLDKLKMETDKDKKYKISYEIQEIIEEEMPVVTIAIYGTAFVMSDKIENYKYNPTAHDYMINTDIVVK